MSSIVARQVQADSAMRSGGAGLPALALVQRQCACGGNAGIFGECDPCRKKKLSVVQAKPALAIGEANDSYEREADRVAEQVLEGRGDSASSNAAPQIRRLPASHSVNGGSRGSAVPASVERVLGESGSPLRADLRRDMERRFDFDFANVRIHSDAAADRSAREVNALAYTAGNHIVFGSGRFDASGPGGRRLLAHELAHVVQQGAGLRPVLARQPAKQPPQPTLNYETDVAVLDRKNMETWATIDYWVQKIGTIFQTAFGDDQVVSRFKDAEERDAVLAALWRVHPDPAKVHHDQTQYVQIPPLSRPEKKNAGELLYRFVFGPIPPDDLEKQAEVPGQAQPTKRVTIFFESENPKGAVTFAPVPPKGYDRHTSKMATKNAGGEPELRYRVKGFGDVNDIAYWEKNPDEEKQLFFWIEQQGPKFAQVLVALTSEEKDKKVRPRRTAFLVHGSKDKQGRITDLEIELLDKSFALTQVGLPKDYHRKDGGDLLLEQIQDKPDPTRKDKLGKVTIGEIPAAEAVPLKYTIWGYFQQGTRNAEVDATITTIGTNKRVFYTIRFRKNNDVDVQRIGEEKSKPELDPTRLDVASVKGYKSDPDHPEKLKAWLRERYPRIKPEGTTEVELRESANRALAADAGKPEWFKDNYGILVLDAAKGHDFLKGLGWKAPELHDFKDFDAEELKLAEIALQTVDASFLRLYKGTRLVRKKMMVDWDKNQRKWVALPKTAGITVGPETGGPQALVLFDSAMVHADERFLGGPDSVRPISAMTVTHEFGHVAERAIPGVRAKFNKFVKDEGIQPFTPYLVKEPDIEFFAETFFLYQTDPEWLKNSYPKLFEWFETIRDELEKKAAKKKP